MLSVMFPVFVVCETSLCDRNSFRVVSLVVLQDDR